MHCVRNLKHTYRIVDYKLVELGMFGSYDSSSNSSSDSDPFPLFFPRKIRTIDGIYLFKCLGVKYYEITSITRKT